MVKVRQNAKSKIGPFDVSCYGEEMIMVDHPVLSSPLPVGPTDTGEFWNDKTDAERAEVILEYIEKKIDWQKTDGNVMRELHYGLKDAEADIGTNAEGDDGE